MNVIPSISVGKGVICGRRTRMEALYSYEVVVLGIQLTPLITNPAITNSPRLVKPFSGMDFSEVFY